MGKIENTIKDILIESFDPSVLSVINESNMHNVPEGSESHFKVVLVSNNFKNIKNVERHQAVYKSLKMLWNPYMHYQFILLMRVNTRKTPNRLILQIAQIKINES